MYIARDHKCVVLRVCVNASSSLRMMLRMNDSVILAMFPTGNAVGPLTCPATAEFAAIGYGKDNSDYVANDDA